MIAGVMACWRTDLGPTLGGLITEHYSGTGCSDQKVPPG